MAKEMTKSQRLARELHALRGRNGLIRAETVVEWARENPASTLHNEFEWSDTKAAQEYRMWQARRVILYNVSVESGERKFVSLSIDRYNIGKGGGYREMHEVLSDESLRDVLVNDALNEYKRMRAKYEHLRELASIHREITRADRKQNVVQLPRRKTG